MSSDARSERELKIAEDIADIKSNIGFIRVIAEKFQKDFDDHKKDDVAYYKKTDRNSIFIVLLWAVFGVAALSSVSQTVLQNTGLIPRSQNAQANGNASSLVQSAAAAAVRT